MPIRRGERLRNARDKTVRERECFAIRHKATGRYMAQHKGEMVDLSDTGCGRTIQLFFVLREAEKAMMRIARWDVPGEPSRAEQFEIVTATVSVGFADHG